MKITNCAEEKNKYINTDLACESGRIDPEEYVHAKYRRKVIGDAVVETLTVEDEAGREETGKDPGRYVTVSDEGLKDGTSDIQALGEIIGKELTLLAERASGSKPGRGSRVLVTGLGNRFITPDALGSKCADKISATRHVMGEYKIFDEIGCSEVSVIKPGVLAQTGIESSDYIKGVADRIKPDLIIVIDAMAARKTSRLATTVQLSDVGLSPGKGIGNHRPAIDRASMGYPVISIGSPTVVCSSTLVWDVLDEAGVDEVSPELERILENGKSFFVSLNDSDAVTDRLSDVISRGVNIALGTSALT